MEFNAKVRSGFWFGDKGEEVASLKISLLTEA